MHKTSLAPVLSATCNLLSVCIISNPQLIGQRQTVLVPSMGFNEG